MKINEIAINENFLTKAAQAGKALPRIERLPGETMKDAIKRAMSELGGVKSADNLVSPTSPGPAVWRNPRTGEVSSFPPAGGGQVPPRPTGPGVNVYQLQTPANSTASMNIDSARRAAAANATKRAAAAKSAKPPAPKPAETPAPKSAETPAPKPAETTADDLSKEIKPGGQSDPPMTPGGQAWPEMIAEPPPSWLSPKGAKGSKTPGSQQSSGGKRDPSMDQPPPAGPGSVPGVHPDWSKPPPASGTTAPPPVININTGKESSWWPGWKTGLTAAAAGPWAYNNFSPKDFPKIPDSVADWPVNLYTAGKNNLLNNRGAKDLKDLTGIDDVKPTPTVVKPEERPTQTQVDKAKADDTDNQKASKRVDDWNRDHPDDPIKEGYTNELNRIVFLSRL